MSLFYLESSILPCIVLSSGPAFRPFVLVSWSPFLGYLGPPFIGIGNALGQPKGSGGVFGRKKPLPKRKEETWQPLLHAGPCVVAINL